MSSTNPDPTNPTQKPKFNDELGLYLALREAKISEAEGGIPIGAVLITQGALNSSGKEYEDHEICCVGHNCRIQQDSAILHAEIAVLEGAGRRSAELYRRCTMYTTLSPCDMCTGAILLYRIPRVVIGENTNFLGGEAYLKSRGVEVVVMDNKECKKLMAKFIREHPEEWNEDIGEL
ncbi:cytosine deaminase [Fomitiporia mediterranea MF3/22]|uniref:cytosine deaminase n=1 Tax=Fomitiporia mediterranea (strain MF3/22) TaxID=694068 RepID=UPI0004409A59|nr:cytosine deaminase [Fomitiporia mediterranea MF3/22]EJD07276.1 cytosine deaminase [Fomitiporia mediterranea MF3/22]